MQYSSVRAIFGKGIAAAAHAVYARLTGRTNQSASTAIVLVVEEILALQATTFQARPVRAGRVATEIDARAVLASLIDIATITTESAVVGVEIGVDAFVIATRL